MTSTTMHDGRVVLHQADCRDVLRGLADNSIDSVVTDPPYALVSIQKRYGKPDSAPTKDVYGRGAAGFMGKTWDTGEVAFSEEFWAEVLRVLKPGGHVVAFSGTRTYHRMAVAIEDAGFEIRDQLGWVYGSGFPKSHNQHGDWEGWGTALKPAWEPICLARKALAGTVAGNLAEWGVGAINVDGCRVPTDGRWPANILHDGSDEVLAAFPHTVSGGGPAVGTPRSRANTYGEPTVSLTQPKGSNEGSAARFFYSAKASRADRDAGLENMRKVKPEELTGRKEGSAGLVMEDGKANPFAGTTGQVPRANTHPTVKPTTLMQWLCRLVTPPGGVILDPFMGSGSTGKAAVLEGFHFVGCEREDEYMPIAMARIAWAIGASSTGTPDSGPVAAQAQPAAANDNHPADLFAAPAQAGAA